VSACGEIAEHSSVYIDWLFRPIEKKTYDLSLSIKYSPTPITSDSYFGDSESGDEKGNDGDREGDDINGNGKIEGNGNGNANIYESEYKVNDWREEREEREGDNGEVERGDGEEKGRSSFTSFTGHHLYL
jgi:hypothetical protein